MVQVTLSAASVIQAKTVTLASNQINEVYLDNPTTAGSTVTVEMVGPSVYPFMPDGWEYDANDGGRMWTFRRSQVAAGEGVQGSTGWTWDTSPVPFFWLWRATEWGADLDPVSPFESWATNTVTGIVTDVSTGTAWATSRPNVVALASHYWSNTTGQAFNWSGHTNGFTERDQVTLISGTGYDVVSWSWLFAQATGTFECTATPNTTPQEAADLYRALVVVYAATEVEIVPAPTVVSASS